MRAAGARLLSEGEEQDMSREAVLLQWERKIEAAERLPSRHEDEGEGGTVEQLRPTEDSTHHEPRRFERRAMAPATLAPRPVGERRTVTITGQPTPARRRRSLIENRVAEPDRLVLWAFLLGLLLVAVAAGTAHA